MRIFIAIRFSNSMKADILKCMNQLKGQGFRGNYTRPDNLHLTLAFIGETTKLNEIRAAVQEVHFEPFRICTGRFGSFRDILWLGVENEKPLQTISENLRKALEKKEIKFDRKPFKAHITLVRKTGRQTAILPEPPKSSMVVTEISIMKSERINGKLVYTEI